MIKATRILILCVFVAVGLHAQDWQRMKVDYAEQLRAGEKLQIDHNSGDEPHLSYFLEASPEDMELLRWRFSSRDHWKAIPTDEHLSYDKAHFSKLQFTERGHSDTLYLRSVGPISDSVFYHRFYPGAAPISDHFGVDLRGEECDCPVPDIEERDDWCTSCPTTQTPVVQEPSHLIVHHSAGVNNSSDWSAVVRSIWDFHVNGRGWDDIGYHFLIDPNGAIYVGRSDNVQGAHFCAQNRNAMGICILGTFTEVLPTAKARGAWVDLTSYAACKWEVSPLIRSLHGSSGLNLLGVSGHRDGCATECPGQMLYGQLNDWRSELRSRMDACSAEEDSLILTAESSLFPYAVNLNWSRGNEDITRYRLQVREQSDEIFGGWQLFFPSDQNTYQIGLRANEEYTFQIEGWTDGDLQQKSNVISWTTTAWNKEKSAHQLVPNPIVGSEVDLVWTDEYRGEFDVAWINMAGQVFPIGKERKLRDTYFKTVPRIHLPAGKYMLRLSFEGKHLYLPVIMI